MKLSEQTVALLKNFSGINQNIQFKAGSKISTISAQKNILVSAEINESFPSDFAIYDLNKMLGVMSLFKDPDLDIGEKTMKIGGKVDYMFADPAMIVSPPDKELAFPDPEITFTLYNSDFSQVIKAASVLGLPHICVEGKDNKMSLVATDVNNSSFIDFYKLKPLTNKSVLKVFEGPEFNLLTEPSKNLELEINNPEKFSFFKTIHLKSVIFPCSCGTM